MATTARTARKSASTRSTARKAAAPAKPAANPVAEVEVQSVRETVAHTADLAAPGTDTERDFEKLLAKEPNQNHTDFVAWFEDKTGVKLDVKTVQYAISTYSEFQRSPEHRATTQARRIAAAEKRAKAQVAKRERLQKQLAKLEEEKATAKA